MVSLAIHYLRIFIGTTVPTCKAGAPASSTGISGSTGISNPKLVGPSDPPSVRAIATDSSSDIEIDAVEEIYEVPLPSTGRKANTDVSYTVLNPNSLILKEPLIFVA